jgi:uncharacterized membrane protein
MKRILMVIPIMTLFANAAILLDIPLLREIVVFSFLSFIPGFAVLRLFKLKEIGFLGTLIFSVALSIASVTFMGLLVNELSLFLGFSQPLSTIPLTIAISAFTLAVFFIEYRRDMSENLKLETYLESKLKNVFLLSIILFLLPILSAIGVLYLNVFIILLSDAIIVALCVMSAVSRRLVPENLYPFLILSISITLLCQVLLTSKNIMGWDANLEYYVFRLTQINGHWGFLNADLNPLVTINYNSMLTITLLPAIYSSLMNAQGEMVFKVLYPFIFSLVPLTLYRICEKQFGKMIGLLSALFFIFTSAAFYGPEPLSLNRQMVGELFLLLSVFILISKTIPVTKRRLLLIIFGASLVISHYSLAYIYMAIVAIIFIISRVKPRFDDTINFLTVSLLFGVTFSWYAITNTPLLSLINTIQATFRNLTNAPITGSPNSGTASALFTSLPGVFSMTTWINLLLVGAANLFLLVGVVSIILKLERKGVSAVFKVMLTMAAVIYVVSLTFGSIASVLNFTRFYAITLLFLSPCFVFGGLKLLEIIGKAWTRISRALKRQIASKSKNKGLIFLPIAIILSAYFLSQVGFVNYVTGGSVYYYNTFFYKMITSNESQVKTSLYSTYIPEQDIYSASWLSNHKIETAEVFADSISRTHSLVSYGTIPGNLLLSITATNPTKGSLAYLGSLNTRNGVIITGIGPVNNSEISTLLDQNDKVYSNYNSEIWYIPRD